MMKGYKEGGNGIVPLNFEPNADLCSQRHDLAAGTHRALERQPTTISYIYSMSAILHFPIALHSMRNLHVSIRCEYIPTPPEHLKEGIPKSLRGWLYRNDLDTQSQTSVATTIKRLN